VLQQLLARFGYDYAAELGRGDVVYPEHWLRQDMVNLISRHKNSSADISLAADRLSGPRG
jgi:hypothetical protein